jgi:hypothetical protein
VTSESTGGSNASPLEQAIVELQRLHEVLLSGDLEPRVLADFRDALNRVRTAAWAAQQYMACKETEQDSASVLSFLVGARIRVTYQLCQAISDDLKRTDVEFQAGSLVQLYEATKALTEQLNSVICSGDDGQAKRRLLSDARAASPRLLSGTITNSRTVTSESSTW